MINKSLLFCSKIINTKRFFDKFSNSVNFFYFDRYILYDSLKQQFDQKIIILNNFDRINYRHKLINFLRDLDVIKLISMYEKFIYMPSGCKFHYILTIQIIMQLIYLMKCACMIVVLN